METTDAQGSPGMNPVKSISIRSLEFPVSKPGNDLSCAICPQPGHFQCSACHGTRYCSRECQKIDRSTHKMFCKSFNSFSASDRPSPLHIRGILFPEDKGKPEWTWILMSEDQSTICVPQLYESLPTDGLTRDVTTMFVRSRTMRDPTHWLTGVLRHQPSRGEDASSINKSLLGLGPPGHLATYWGPLLMVSNMPGQVSPTDGAKSVARFKDLEMHDVWTIILLLTWGDKKSPCLVNDPRAPPRSLPGIKINCVGDCIRFHPDKDPNSDTAIYEAVTVPRAAPFPEKCQWPSMLAVMMGLPWLCRVVYNSSNLWAKDPNGDYSITDKALVANPELGLLHAFLQTASREDIVAPGQSERVIKATCLSIEPGPHYGSVILLHMYGQLIRPEHIKMVNIFVEERGLGTLGLKEMNLNGFDEYWNQKQRDNNVPGIDLQGVPSPYAGRGLPHPREHCVENLDLYKSFFKEVGKAMSLPRAFVWTDGSVASG